MTFITEPRYSTLRTIQKNGLAATKGFIENILYSCSIHSYGSASSVISYSSKDAAKIHFFRKVCEKKVRFFEKKFSSFRNLLKTSKKKFSRCCILFL